MLSKQGRPREIPGPTAARVQVVVSIQTSETLQRIARREGRSVSRLLREVLDDYAKRHARDNPQTGIDAFAEDPTYRALPDLWRIEVPGDLDKIDSPTLQEILVKVRQLEFLAKRRLRSRGEDTEDPVGYPPIRWPDVPDIKGGK